MKQHHAANVLWSALEAAVSALLSFTSALVVARLVSPAEVGIAAAAMALHVLLWIAVNALFADALVQRHMVDDETFASALTASVAIGGLAAAVLLAMGPVLAWSLHDGRLLAMSAALAAPLPLVGAAGPVQGLLTRQRRYQSLAWRTVIGQGLGTTIGIGGALLGAGAWALVLQQCVTSGIGSLTLLFRCPMRPRCGCDAQHVRELLRLGLPLATSTLVFHARYRLFALLIGWTAGAAALGQVHMAFRLIDAVRELASTAQWRLMLPLLAERQHDLPDFRHWIDRCLGWSSLLAFPLCAVMAVSIQPLVAILLGPVWQPAGEAALPLIALAAWLFLAFPAGVAVVALGEARPTLIVNVAGLLAIVAGVLLLQPASPLTAVLIWIGAQALTAPYALRANGRVLGMQALRPLRAGVPMLAAMLLATALACTISTALSPWMLLLERLLILAAVGIPVVVLRARSAARPARPVDGTLRLSGSDS